MTTSRATPSWDLQALEAGLEPRVVRVPDDHDGDGVPRTAASLKESACTAGWSRRPRRSSRRRRKSGCCRPPAAPRGGIRAASGMAAVGVNVAPPATRVSQTLVAENASSVPVPPPLMWRRPFFSSTWPWSAMLCGQEPGARPRVAGHGVLARVVRRGRDEQAREDAAADEDLAVPHQRGAVRGPAPSGCSPPRRTEFVAGS